MIHYRYFYACLSTNTIVYEFPDCVNFSSILCKKYNKLTKAIAIDIPALYIKTTHVYKFKKNKQFHSNRFGKTDLRI